MDIAQLEKLKSLKDKGILTQEELDEQVSTYLNSLNENSDKVNLGDFSTHLKIKHILYIVAICIGIYIAVETIFPGTIPCKDNVSENTCNCIKQAISRKAAFLDKVKILIVGASRDELASYLALGDAFRCGAMED